MESFFPSKMCALEDSPQIDKQVNKLSKLCQAEAKEEEKQKTIEELKQQMQMEALTFDNLVPQNILDNEIFESAWAPWLIEAQQYVAFAPQRPVGIRQRFLLQLL